MLEFFELTAQEIDKDKDEGTVAEVFKPVLDSVKEKVQKFSLGHGVVYTYLELLHFFTRKECLAKVS